MGKSKSNGGFIFLTQRPQRQDAEVRREFLNQEITLRFHAMLFRFVKTPLPSIKEIVDLCTMPAMFPSILKMKCPVCREGSVFKHPNPYALRTLGEMYPVCPVCGQNFRPEPGFYFGGAVISYPLMVIFGALVVGLYYVITGDLFDNYLTVMAVLSLAIVAVSPVVFRYSRILFLYFVFRYRGNS